MSQCATDALKQHSSDFELVALPKHHQLELQLIILCRNNLHSYRVSSNFLFNNLQTITYL